MSIRMRGGVDRVTVLRRDDRGNVVRSDKIVDDLDQGIGIDYVVRDQSGLMRRGEVTEEIGPPKKQSKLSKTLNKRVRKMAAGNARTLTRYIRLHDRSNSLKKNGWIRDLVKNVKQARRKP
jgi:Family of unknown function (DUF6312)